MMLENKANAAATSSQASTGPNMLAYSDATHSKEQFKAAKESSQNLIEIENRLKFKSGLPSFSDSKQSSEVAN